MANSTCLRLLLVQNLLSVKASRNKVLYMMQYFFLPFISICTQVRYIPSNTLLFQVINPLCEYLETDLRLQVHSHLQLDDRNPFHGKVNDASGFLALPPLLLGEMYINIKAKVEAYLEKTFYNLTTVALHNWRTYGEMRAMATHNYKVFFFLYRVSD